MNAHLEAAHKHCIRNRDALQQSKICGCFYCRTIYSPNEITEWLREGNGTAFCPHCGIDSVIGDASGYPITKEFLEEMYEYWFNRAK